MANKVHHHFSFWVVCVCLLWQPSLFTRKPEKIVYNLTQEPIDVVIPCTKNDLSTLEICIKGIRDNGKRVNRINLML
jgi:hypothetical protein